MFLDRIKEEKSRTGITTKAMAEATTLHIAEETMSRFLTGKIHDPHVSTLLDIGATVGLAPYELFMDSVTAAEFRAYLEAKVKNIDNTAELELLRIKNAELEAANSALLHEKEHTLDKIAHLEEVLRLKDDIISAYRPK